MRDEEEDDSKGMWLCHETGQHQSDSILCVKSLTYIQEEPWQEGEFSSGTWCFGKGL